MGVEHEAGSGVLLTDTPDVEGDDAGEGVGGDLGHAAGGAVREVAAGLGERGPQVLVLQ